MRKLYHNRLRFEKNKESSTSTTPEINNIPRSPNINTGPLHVDGNIKNNKIVTPIMKQFKPD